MEKERKSIKNFIELNFPSLPKNTAIAMDAIAVLAKQMTPTPTHGDIFNITTAVKEAVENATIHAYPTHHHGLIYIRASIFNHNLIEIKVLDKGPGIQNVQEARTGIGFKIMENFMTQVDVQSIPGKGTTVTMQYRVS